jgi:hypothetical protein
MSAFIVSDKHIDYLIGSAITLGAKRGDFDWASFHDGAADMARALEVENWRSVSYRYNESSEPPPPRQLNWFHFASIKGIDPVVTLKAIQCYEYQSCEHPDWEVSAARKFCDRLRSLAIASLPGYDAAPWGID